MTAFEMNQQANDNAKQIKALYGRSMIAIPDPDGLYLIGELREPALDEPFLNRALEASVRTALMRISGPRLILRVPVKKTRYPAISPRTLITLDRAYRVQLDHSTAVELAYVSLATVESYWQYFEMMDWKREHVNVN